MVLFETKMTIAPFKIQSTDVEALVVVSQVPKLLLTASYRIRGEIALQMHNASFKAKLLSYKAYLLGVILYVDTKMSWNASVKERVESNSRKLE